ncbi:MAG TPA: alpha/beta hydrolase [Burkholderiales bacterium]|nr:alpha/beta hydrolase [Burkholderiales bacterium]
MRARLAAVLAALAATACTAVFFQPHRLQVSTPAKMGLEYQDVRFKASDGVELFGWFLPAKGPAIGTVLQLHGNAENISTHFASLAWMPERGFNVFIFDYRGYGGSEGEPTLEGVQLDIDAAMAALLARGDIDRSRIVMYGQSLGGALAAYYVAHSSRRDRIRALVLESAFSDYVQIAREKFADHWITWPFQWIPYLSVDDRFSPLPAIAKISPIPLLILHGDQDRIVPVSHARILYEAASQPKQLWIVPGAGHIQTTAKAAQRDRLVAYLRGVLAAPPDRSPR